MPMTMAASLALAPRAATVGDFLALLKPRVMSLVVFTGLAGIAVASPHPDGLTAVIALLSIAVGAGASGALNMAYDADIDALMSRTASRPVPRKAIAPEDALAFGWTLAGGAVMVMALFVNFLAAGLLALSIGFYVFVYTLWLKRRTPQNIVIGGLAGALPPAIGWAAVTGSLSAAPLALVFIIFLWTPPHFWALSLFRCDDYARAHVPMLPVARGKPETRRQILLYAISLLPAGFLPVLAGVGGAAYAVIGAAFGLAMLWQAWRVTRETDEIREPQARRLFGISIVYLFALFATLIGEQLVGLAPLRAWM
jgi:protoheme IX farnesyltransferase